MYKFLVKYHSFGPLHFLLKGSEKKCFVSKNVIRQRLIYDGIRPDIVLVLKVCSHMLGITNLFRSRNSITAYFPIRSVFGRRKRQLLQYKITKSEIP